MPRGQLVGLQGTSNSNGDLVLMGPFVAGDWLVAVLAGLVHTGSTEATYELTFALTHSREVSVSNLNRSVPLVFPGAVPFAGATIPIIRQQVGHRSSSVFSRYPVGRRVLSGPWWVLAWMRTQTTSVVAGFGVEVLTWVLDPVVGSAARVAPAGANVLEDLRRGASEARAAAPGA